MNGKIGKKTIIVCLSLCALLTLELFSFKTYFVILDAGSGDRLINTSSAEKEPPGKLLIKKPDLFSALYGELTIISSIDIRRLRPLSKTGGSAALFFSIQSALLVYLCYKLKLYKRVQKKTLSPIITFMHETDGMK